MGGTGSKPSLFLINIKMFVCLISPTDIELPRSLYSFKTNITQPTLLDLIFDVMFITVVVKELYKFFI